MDNVAPHTSEAAEPKIDPAVFARRWMILAVLCMSLMIVIIGNTSLNTALPTLARELDASTTSLQWMVDSYSLIFAGLLFTAGTIGDRFGRKGTLQAGLVLFLVGAMVAAFADTASMVIIARAVMGVAAAFIMPSTLSILTNVFPANERPKAIGIWAGISGGGAAIGPIASGWLLEHFWWGSVFLVNVPFILVALVAGAILVPKSKDPDDHPIDIPGAVLSIVALTSLVYGIIEAPHNGWTSPETLTTFAVAAVAVVAFIWRESTTASPMLDLQLFRDRRFSVASAGMTLTFFAMFGTFFLLAQYLQLVLDYSPLESGLLQLPVAFIIMMIAPRIPKVVDRFGARWVVPVGLTFVAFGLSMLSFLGVDSPLANVYYAMVPLATGMAITMTPLTTLIMTSVPLGRAGVGSAMNDTTRELGGALGVAVLGSIVTSQYGSGVADAVGGLPDQLRGLADSGLSGALAAGAQIGGSDGEALAASARQAFVDGLGIAALVGAAVVFTAAIVTRSLLPRPTTPPRAGTMAHIPVEGELEPTEHPESHPEPPHPTSVAGD
ncbi:MFS transporter [Ilumatobacter sp.]|uniref:MFS transporter n=1 Tax=Ilumatobacter sp. TaxID=1967498 RepID=UPI003C590066